ncbi:PIN domain-containing protein [Kribbella solani]|uniref:type II toxin-antitoxin system VapC family toxin n=1 Tax=Kribbella solani TaxID=236067 RepID=UPI0029BCF4AA|nr:PIN domain-containing protein [Kribbella solani]MDX2972856.1 PIN domain-containing protein [Kribbella solani]MDX3004199.1 PIN domain-containing protein [Kribbella solani]
MIVVDTGPLVAAVLSNDDDHRVCVDLFAAAHLNREQLVVPSFVIPEVCYLIQRDLGAKVEADFVESLAAGDFAVAECESELDRIADLMHKYADLPLGVADAAVVAVAEALGAREVATLDRRHFTVVRPRHLDAFALLP